MMPGIRERSAGVRAGLVLLFCVAIVLVDPRGDFPLDDDWDFALTSWHFSAHGELVRTPFSAATSYAQAIWGALWTRGFGQSYTTLRASTLALALISMLLIFSLLLRAGSSRWLATFGTLGFVANPLYFWSAFTFMTHVPTVLLGILAMGLFLRGVDSGRIGLHGLAALAGIASAFSRQTAIVNLLTAIAIVLVLREQIGARWRGVVALYSGALLFLAGLMSSTDVLNPSSETGIHAARLGGDWRALFTTVVAIPVHYSFFNAQNAALFYAPLLVLSLTVLGRQPFRRKSLMVITAIFATAAIHMISLRRPIPYFNAGNVFSNLGLGPHTLRDTFTFRFPYPHSLAYGARLALMALTAIAAIAVAAILIRWSRRDEAETGTRAILIRYCAVYCVIGTILHCGMRLYFDRYSIDTMWPLPILLTLLASRAPIARATWVAATLLLLITLAFATIFTAEYLSWNRARWDGYRFLRAHGVALEQMDGGYEVNALLAMRTGRKDLGKPGFAVVDDEYILAFQDVRGFERLARFPYSRWLGLSEGYVYALRRWEKGQGEGRLSR